jgi:FKBP-type peptidyl-prolyl cis-trans isomerase FkpA/FKBP-type peptidyl-prolyl cis-trans isomerase FklB
MELLEVIAPEKPAEQAKPEPKKAAKKAAK